MEEKYNVLINYLKLLLKKDGSFIEKEKIAIIVKAMEYEETITRWYDADGICMAEEVE